MFTRIRPFVPLAAVPLAALLSGAAAAQSIPAIAVNDRVEGSLPPGTAASAPEGQGAVYRFEARRGERFSARVESADFPPAVLVRGPVEAGGAVVHADSAFELDRIHAHFHVPEAGAYELVVLSSRRGAGGAFVLELGRGFSPSVEERPIAVGQTVRDSLPEFAADGGRWNWWVSRHIHALEGRAGQQLLVTMTSDDFEPQLGFAEFRPMAMYTFDWFPNRDRQGVEMLVTFPNDGRFAILANSASEDGTGAYTLTVDAYVPPPGFAGRLAARQEVAGTFGPGHPTLERGTPYDDWLYVGRRNERVRVHLGAEAFDTRLRIGRAGDGAFQELASAEGTRADGAFVEFTLPEAGEYVVRVSARRRGAAGAYTLRVQ